MAKTSLFFGLALKALLASTLALAQVDRPPQTHSAKFSDIRELNPGYNGFTGLRAVPSTPFTKTRWPWGKIPQNCKEKMSDQNLCNVYDIEVYEIKYNDCPDRLPHLVCRCNNARTDIDSWARELGRMPASAREWVRDAFLIAAWADGNTNCGASTNTFDITFFGNCTADTSTYIHETMHNFDYQVLEPAGQWYSLTQDWKNKVSQGSCVADIYAKTDYLESFAQVGPLVFFNDNIRPVWDLKVECMTDQVRRAMELMGGRFKRTGAQCTRVWGKAPVICMGPAAASACASSPRLAASPASPEGGEIPPALSPELQAKVDEWEREALIQAGWISAKSFTA